MALDAVVTGRIATFAGDAGYGWVEAIGIRDGRVAVAGRASEVEAGADARTKRVELASGEVALPAITDAHIHLVDAAIASRSLDIFRADALDDALAMVVDAAARIPAPGWILGSGWDQRRWGAWPRADMLERVVPGRHVALRSFDLHALWASPAALTAAGIDASTPDPEGGIIRRSADGTPDGIFFEKASELVMSRVPPPTQEMLRAALRSLGRECLTRGVVGVHELGTLFPDTSNDSLDLFAAVADAGVLPIRVHAGVRADGLENALERGFRSGARIGEADPTRLAFGWLKLFADGTLGSRTAALLLPREGTDERGMFTNPPEFLAERTMTAATAGIATTIHTIGDAAVRTALDILGPTAASSAFMPRLEHIQLCDPADRKRFRRLGVAASVQPIHLREDAPGARLDWGDRAESAGYTWRSLLDAGATLAFGQDAPLEPVDPWPGIAISVLRRDSTWPASDADFGPNQAISLVQALRASTIGPWETVRDPVGGRLVPGSLADVIVLPAEPTETLLRAAHFESLRPRLVLLGGTTAFEREPLRAERPLRHHSNVTEQPRTIVFFPEGAFGPTNNCVGIGRVLRERGHRVVFIVEESFAGRLEAQGFEERLMRLGPPPTEPEIPGQFWIDFIRDTAPIFRKPTIEQLGEFIVPTWQALVDGSRYVDDRLRRDCDLRHEQTRQALPVVHQQICALCSRDQ